MATTLSSAKRILISVEAPACPRCHVVTGSCSGLMIADGLHLIICGDCGQKYYAFVSGKITPLDLPLAPGGSVE